MGVATMRWACFILAVALVLSTTDGCSFYVPPEPDPRLRRLDWLVGDWSAAPDESGSATEEHWMAPSTSSMFGIGRTLREGKEVSVEYLRIAAEPDGVVYYAAPGGRLPATPFHAVECGSRRAVFENLEHDYPQRIIYELQFGGSIKARIEGDVDGELKSSEWILRRIR